MKDRFENWTSRGQRLDRRDGRRLERWSVASDMLAARFREKK